MAQVDVVHAIKQTATRDPIDEARKQQALSAETQKLAGLVVVSQAIREPSVVGAGATTNVSPEVAKARTQVLNAAQTELEQKEREVRAAAVKAPNDAVRAALETQAVLLAAKKRDAAKRRALLAQGKDTNKPQRVAPARVSKPRDPLPLPHTFVPPNPGEIVAVVQVLTAALPSQTGETAQDRRIKVRGLLERTLARMARKQSLAGKSPTLVEDAVADTLRIDEPVIAAEVKETGGLVHDNAGEVFEALIEEVGVEVDRAAISTTPVTPTVTPSPAQVDAVLTAALDEIELDDQAPKESWDEIREDLVLADQRLPSTPFWQQPRVWAVGGAALVLLLVFRGR